MRFPVRGLTSLVTVLLCASLLNAQNPAPVPTTTAAPKTTSEAPAQATPRASPQGEQAPKPAALDEETRKALASLADKLTELRSKQRQARDDGEVATATRLGDEIESAQYEFAKLTARIDVEQFEDKTKAAFDVQQELEKILRPLLRALSDATAGPRELTELSASLDQARQKRETAQKAFDSVQRTLAALPEGSPARAEAQRELDERWRPTLNRLGSEILVLNASIAQREEARKSVWETVTENTHDFIESRGINLLLAISVFALTWVLIGFVGRRMLRLRPRMSFARRLGEVLLRLVAGVFALAATIVVLYTRDDMLLLAIAFVFLVGVGWVVIKTAPQFLEQIRLVLNVGAVREGERITVDGLPYRVEALRFYSWLKNPLLQGGSLRVPLKELVDKRSRPIAEGEPWFPCEVGNVVALSDGTVGLVHVQTPEVVTVAMRGLPPQHIPTADFLALRPRNLSAGFEIRVVFGVDYAHQKDVLTAVPAAMARAVERALQDDPDAAHVKSVKAEFSAAGASSLDVMVLVAFEGPAALRYWPLHRRINQALVAACTEHGYGIPFPQLTVHQAK